MSSTTRPRRPLLAALAAAVVALGALAGAAPAAHAAAPVVTVPGSFQAEIGCPGDWQPECLRSELTDPDGDGVYTGEVTIHEAGTWEGKVAHDRSWAENYGVGGAPGGANYRFRTGADETVGFQYTLSTHLLEILVANPSLPGEDGSQAHWVDETTLAWPATLGSTATDAAWELYSSEDADIATANGAVTGATPLPLTRIAGGLTADQRAAYPALAGYTALRLDGQDRAAVADLLRGQLVVAQHEASGALTALTGVQIPGVLDDLYADALGDVALGATWSGGTATLRLWAPTAQGVELVTGSATLPAAFDAASGVWSVAGVASGTEYRWRVTVYAPTTGRIETNTVTDPYSVALTRGSTRSVAIDLADPAFRPGQWSTASPPAVAQPVDRAIYELHIRDFSIGDTTVPAGERGTYRAFTEDSAGTAQLRQLAEAGINTVHLLPSFDIASIGEDRAAQEVPACDLASYPADSPQQQACVAAAADTDGYNWGYDPFHYTTPEGSYAVDANGGARVAEFRSMVGALHGMGLQVVLDQVFNHTAASGQAPTSVLDQVVPGYYQRLDATGAVQTSTCCQNVATEHAAAEKLMVDSIVTWARDYKVDGFRFDLMGHASKANMLAIRAALDELTLADDGVDGSAVFLYGEGWNFGEVANNALFEQATQGQLGGTGIATFNDRLRDAVHGGSPVDAGTIRDQGWGTGVGTDPNGVGAGGLDDLGAATDLVKLGLAGNLRAFTFITSDGTVQRGDQLDYNGQPAGYADEPDEVINYVDAHDNQTLFDTTVMKLPADTPMADRVRMNTVELATVTLSQSPAFWHAGTELLRSKSLDRNSYNSGDWFNRIDWTGQTSAFGSGLPPAADNSQHWADMGPLLADPAIKPSASDIATAESEALDLLRIRQQVGLLTLGSAALIQEKLTFPTSTDAAPGAIAMLVDDTKGDDADPDLDAALVMFNPSPEAVTQTIPELAGRELRLVSVQADGRDPVVKTTAWNAATGTVTVPARTVAVLVEPQQAGGTPPATGGGDPSGTPGGDPSTMPGSGKGGGAVGSAGSTDGTLAFTGADGAAAWLLAAIATGLVAAGVALRLRRQGRRG